MVEAEKLGPYDSLTAKQLKSLVRRKFVTCRGAFAAEATKEEMLEVLKTCKTDEVLRKFYARKTGAPAGVPNGDTSAKDAVKLPSMKALRMTREALRKVNEHGRSDLEVVANNGDALTEGVAGENPPADGKSHWNDSGDVAADVAGEITKVLSAVSQLSPVAAKEIRNRMRVADEARKELAEVRKQLGQMTQTAMEQNLDLEAGEKVSVAGLDMPVVMAKDHPAWAYVPPLDQHYDFDAWLAKREAGGEVFRQDIKDLMRILMADFRVLLVGPPSVGKTSVIEQIAARCQWGVCRFNGSRDVTVMDFVGTYEAHNGATHWVDGPLPRAMREGMILLVDEIDHMPAECTSILHSALEPGGKLVITSNGGEVVEPHDNFRIVATSNTAGFGDETGLHPNAKVQDAALLSRFEVVLHPIWMSIKKEADLLAKATGLDANKAKLVAKLASDTRSAVDAGNLLHPVTLRQTLAWAKAASRVGFETAFALTVLNKAHEHDISTLKEIAQRHFGADLNAIKEG